MEAAAVRNTGMINQLPGEPAGMPYANQVFS